MCIHDCAHELPMRFVCFGVRVCVCVFNCVLWPQETRVVLSYFFPFTLDEVISTLSKLVGAQPFSSWVQRGSDCMAAEWERAEPGSTAAALGPHTPPQHQVSCFSLDAKSLMWGWRMSATGSSLLWLKIFLGHRVPALLCKLLVFSKDMT